MTDINLCTHHGITVEGASQPVGRISTSDLPIPLDAPLHGLYVHIPFCFHKCHYCDFYSIVDTQDRQEPFTEALIRELNDAGERLAAVQTIFIGGGTPTLLRVDLWDRLLEAMADVVAIDDLIEFTVEANPETVTAELMQTFMQGGVNRISIGAQSFDPRHLKTLERWHDPANVQRSVEIARSAGIDNINLDLIYAIPGQTLEDWQHDLDRALLLEPTHLSCYSLMYEPNTPMTVKLRQGRFERVDEDIEAAMFENTIDCLTAAGFEHYEISNFARPRMQCEHNLIYWRNQNWWAIGPSASGHVNGVRWKNHARLGEYIDRAPDVSIVDVEKLDADAQLGEQLMLGLRLMEGIELADLPDDFGGEERQDAIERHEASGLLELTPTHLRLTQRGVRVADSVILDLL